MKTAGGILQFMAWVTTILCAFGFVSYLVTPNEAGLAVAVLIGGIISSLLLFGIGGAFFCIEDMAIDARRSAEANERTAEAMEYLTRRQRAAQKPTAHPQTDAAPPQPPSNTATVLRRVRSQSHLPPKQD